MKFKLYVYIVLGCMATALLLPVYAQQPYNQSIPMKQKPRFVVYTLKSDKREAIQLAMPMGWTEQKTAPIKEKANSSTTVEFIKPNALVTDSLAVITVTVVRFSQYPTTALAYAMQWIETLNQSTSNTASVSVTWFSQQESDAIFSWQTTGTTGNLQEIVRCIQGKEALYIIRYGSDSSFLTHSKEKQFWLNWLQSATVVLPSLKTLPSALRSYL
jgi:hypothetical protein